MTIPEFYHHVGGNYDDAISRLQSDAFLGKFLRMLPKDGSMALLTSSMESGNTAEAFRAVHTLKGVALNLGLSDLATACSTMTEALRGCDALPEGSGALYDAVAREYTRVSEALPQLDG